ncbi:hypothetical protein [Bacillus thuringiensis]|uniref:hypothetical protein n=1 Tax=Bacillus thuringiensis TaxID=1428 RepID=UPI002248A2B1|nr:hypothetical protein [Bacillus thuringiensis]
MRKIKSNENQNKIKRECFLRECFHQDENCSGNIIKAHSIQNNRILNKIAEDGEVCMITGENDDSLILTSTMERIGRKRATTFTGFCGRHDKDLFTPIEDKEYQKGNQEQEFLFAYRALAKEYHTKTTVGDMYRKVLQYLRAEEYDKLSDIFNGNSKPEIHKIVHVARTFKKCLVGNEYAEAKLNLYKDRMNSFLENSQFDEIITEVIELNEEYHIAVSSITFIEKDLNGRIINNIGDSKISLAPLFITVFPQDGKTYILLSYFKRNERRYKFIKEQILTESIEMQKVIVSNLIVAYLENWAISPIKWNELSKEMRAKIHKYFVDTITPGDGGRPLLYDKTLNLFL